MTTGPPKEISEESYNKIMRACQLFTVKELKNLLDTRDDCFPAIVTSAQIQKVIMVNKLEANKMNFITVLEEFLRKCKITPIACTTYLQNLGFQDVIFHKKKVWKAIELLDPKDPSKLKPTEVQFKSNVLRKMKEKLQLSADIQLEHENQITWGMLIDIKYNKKGVPRYGNPSYFSFTEDQSTLCLCTNKFSTIVDILVESFGYCNYKRCELTGQDVRTLHALVSARRSSGLSSAPASPATDTSLSRASRNNARYLSAKNIDIQEVQIKCHTDWRGSRVNKKRKKLNSVNSSLQIQAPNIGLFIQSLIDDGVILDPKAGWVTRLGTTKSNIISDEIEE